MLSIVGGTYYENCKFPTWDEVYGSGLRACLALEGFDVDVHFTTCMSINTEKRIRALLKDKRVELTVYQTESTVEFYYLHGLSSPKIVTESEEKIGKAIEVEKALVFGMLEADIEVHGKRIVYDPQAPLEPKFFTENGSTFESLAMVLNSSEALSLSNSDSIQNAGIELLKHADVVIIKQGSSGAKVFTENEVDSIPAFKTDEVFSIGSGDIFSAVFSYYWLEELKEPKEAAFLASRATSLFCNSRALPIRPHLLQDDKFDFLPLTYGISNENKYNVYLAGPFFTVSEYWFINDIRTCMQNMGIEVFSPIHDVGTGSAKIIAEKDLEALQNSDLIFAVADGTDVGTMFEIGYAKANNLPVIIFSSLPMNHNETMLLGTNCEIYNDLTTSIYKAAWRIFEG